MRRRQSMQVLELESRVEQLIAENRALQDARAQAEAHTTNRATSTLAERDTEIEALKQSLDFMRKEGAEVVIGGDCYLQALQRAQAAVAAEAKA